MYIFTYITDTQATGTWNEECIFEPDVANKVNIQLTKTQLESFHDALQFIARSNKTVESFIIPKVKIQVDEEWLKDITSGDTLSDAKLEVSESYGVQLIMRLRRSTLPVELNLPGFSNLALSTHTRLQSEAKTRQAFTYTTTEESVASHDDIELDKDLNLQDFVKFVFNDNEVCTAYNVIQYIRSNKEIVTSVTLEIKITMLHCDLFMDLVDSVDKPSEVRICFAGPSGLATILVYCRYSTQPIVIEAPTLHDEIIAYYNTMR